MNTPTKNHPNTQSLLLAPMGAATLYAASGDDSTSGNLINTVVPEDTSTRDIPGAQNAAMKN